MKKAALTLCALLLLSTSMYAQRPARGLYLGLGLQTADVDELNGRLAAFGYPTFSENFLAVGLGYTWFGDDLVASVDIGGAFQPSKSNDDFRTNLSGGWGLLNLGVALRPSSNFMIYPMASVGGGAMQLNIQTRADISFDDLLLDPGRRAEISTASLLFGPRIGMHYVLGGGERRFARRGIGIGLRAGYLFSAFEGDWLELENDEVNGGPDTSLEGFHVMLTVGAYGARSRRW